MLVNVYLDGALGKAVGKHWKLSASTPSEVLGLIQANTGKLTHWLKTNARRYANYRILATFKNGKREYLTKDTLFTANEIKSIRFTPIVEGAGNAAKVVVGVVLMVASIWLGPIAFQAGMTLAMGGVAGLLTPKQKSGSTKTSHYFQGVGRNQMQGSPVPLIYGRCKVEGIPISKQLTVS